MGGEIFYFTLLPLDRPKNMIKNTVVFFQAPQNSFQLRCNEL